MPVARVHLRLGRNTPLQHSSSSVQQQNLPRYSDTISTVNERPKSGPIAAIFIDADSLASVSTSDTDFPSKLPSATDDSQQQIRSSCSDLTVTQPSFKQQSIKRANFADDVKNSFRPNLLQSVAVEIKRSYDHLLKYVDDDETTDDEDGGATVKLSSAGLMTQDGLRNIVRIAALPVK